MSIIKQPDTTVNKASASLAAGLDTQKLLILGQKTSKGSAIAKSLYKDVEEANIDTLFGKNSALSVTLKAVFEEFDKTQSPNLPRVDVIPLDDNVGGSNASGSIAFSPSGPATDLDKNGSIFFNICGKEVELELTEGDDISAEIPQSFEALVSDETLPLDVSEAGGTVTMEFKNKGTINNNGTILVEGLSEQGGNYYFGNMQVTVTPFSGGATDPDTTDILDVVEKIRYQTLSYPVEYGTDLATDFLDSRFNVSNDIKDGVAVLKNTGTRTALKALLDTLNSQSVIYLCNKSVSEDNFDGGEDLELDYVNAARCAAIRALRLTTNASLANIIPAAINGANDAFGGAHMASLPYMNTPISGAPLQPEGKGWTDTDIVSLFASGGSVVGNNRTGSSVIMGEFLTTYKTDAAGNEDLTWRFLNTVDTMSVCAEYIFNNIKKDFVQNRLTTGKVIRGYSMTNKQSFTSKLQEYYLSLADLALVPKSQEAVNFFINNLSTVINTVSGKITTTAQWPIVVQLREILVTLKTNFGQSLV